MTELLVEFLRDIQLIGLKYTSVDTFQTIAEFLNTITSAITSSLFMFLQ